jgi:hypothetical protein
VRGLDNLEVDDRDVVYTRRDPDDRLNSLATTVIDGLAGIFRWVIGFARFFLCEAIVVQEKGMCCLPTCLGGIIYQCAR